MFFIFWNKIMIIFGNDSYMYHFNNVSLCAIISMNGYYYLPLIDAKVINIQRI